MQINSNQSQNTCARNAFLQISSFNLCTNKIPADWISETLPLKQMLWIHTKDFKFIPQWKWKENICQKHLKTLPLKKKKNVKGYF